LAFVFNKGLLLLAHARLDALPLGRFKATVFAGFFTAEANFMGPGNNFSLAWTSEPCALATAPMPITAAKPRIPLKTFVEQITILRTSPKTGPSQKIKNALTRPGKQL